MKLSYNLKPSIPTDILKPLMAYLQQNYSHQVAMSFRTVLSQINDLRNKAITLKLSPNLPQQQQERMIDLLATYTRYALVIMNRFNWNSDRGKIVENLSLVWFDSFQPKVQFQKTHIVIDVFCCYYNLAILYLTRAISLTSLDTDAANKDAMLKAKYAAFLLREMKEKYYRQFVNSGFHDTQYAHLDILESISLGVVYKSLYNSLKPIEFKIGINNIANICAASSRHFYKAYSVAQSFFMNPSGISDKTKQQIMALTYIQSLYFDVMSNARYAKHYATMLDRDKSKLALVIAYEKKAMRLLQIGLKNPAVQMLLSHNNKQKVELIQIQNELYLSLKSLVQNATVMRMKQIEQNDLPKQETLPQQYVAKLTIPPSLVLQNQGEFVRLMSEQAYLIGQQMNEYSSSKQAHVVMIKNTLEDEIERIKNQSFVNYYLQLQTPELKIPDILQQKLLEIRKLGGKNKLQMNTRTITENQKNTESCFKHLQQQLKSQTAFDQQKRNQYGSKWTLEPSSEVNRDFVTQIEELQNMFNTAVQNDKYILQKCQRNASCIDSLGSDEVILKLLPKPQLTKFVQMNQRQLANLRDKHTQLRKHQQYAYQLASQIVDALSNTNYAQLANNALIKRTPREQIFQLAFNKSEEMINKFSSECKAIKDKVNELAIISLALNSKNKDQQKDKKQFEIIINCYNQIAQLYGQCTKSFAFYQDLNAHLSKLTADVEQYIYARKRSAQEHEKAINMKVEDGFMTHFPDMYPGQKKQPLPHFTAPPVPPSLYTQAQKFWGPQVNLTNHFKDNVKPSNFPSNPFEGEVFMTRIINNGNQQQQNLNRQPSSNQLNQTSNQFQNTPGQNQGILPPLQGLFPLQNQGQQNPGNFPALQGLLPIPGQNGQGQGQGQGYPNPNFYQQMQNPNFLQQPQTPGLPIPAQSTNFRSDPFLGTVFPSTHLRR